MTWWKMKWFSISRERCILGWRKQMSMIDVQKLHQRQRVNQVDPREEFQNRTVQVVPNQDQERGDWKRLKNGACGLVW